MNVIEMEADAFQGGDHAADASFQRQKMWHGRPDLPGGWWGGVGVGGVRVDGGGGGGGGGRCVL